MAFFIEILSRGGLGDGLLELVVYEVEELPTINIDIKFELNSRTIHDIFTELGFDRERPIRSQQPRPLPDRAALDRIIFDEIGLTAAERREVYWSVAEMVKDRLDKAKSR
jgi:hypothetical protein